MACGWRGNTAVVEDSDRDDDYGVELRTGRIASANDEMLDALVSEEDNVAEELGNTEVPIDDSEFVTNEELDGEEFDLSIF